MPARIEPPRVGKYRDYLEDTVLRLSFIRHAKELGEPQVACCWIYVSSGKDRGVPPVSLIAQSLENPTSKAPSSKAPSRSIGWKSSFAMAPGIGAMLISKLTCELSDVGISTITHVIVEIPSFFNARYQFSLQETLLFK